MTRHHAFTTPLRYPGGKAVLANFAKLILTVNNLLDGHYVEVYAGGAGLAWPLLFDDYVRHVHINDLDKSIIAFWRSVTDHTDLLCRLIRDTPVTIEEWYRQKEVQRRPDTHSIVELGFSTFFLNRTNRSGIIKGGVIGGHAQGGQWRLDARFNKMDLMARIERIARYSGRIHVYEQNAVDFIQAVLPTLPLNSLVYLDPPYYEKGKGLYEHHYEHADHAEIARLVTQLIRQPWIVSYDAVPQIMRLYQGFRHHRYDLSYSAQLQYAGAEVIFFSQRLRLPLVDHPVWVDQARLHLAQ